MYGECGIPVYICNMLHHEEASTQPADMMSKT